MTENNNSSNNDTQTNFGYQKVSHPEKKNLINEVFSSVASKYDVMNDLMSFGVHRIWKDKFVRKIANLNAKIIDVAGGTGDIAFRVYARARQVNKNIHITVCDLNPDMLKICQDKAINQNILDNFDTKICDAENLPFDDNTFDYYTISFGIRNVASIPKALSEAYRVLKPTGKFLCLEFSHVQNEYTKRAYDFYSKNIIPKMGEIVTNDRKSYDYLVDSIQLFPNQEQFKALIQDAGFIDVAYENMSFGVAAIHYGYK